MTNEQLTARLAFWQRVLRLQDWEIQASIVTVREMRNDDEDGACEWLHAKKRAVIRILAEADYPAGVDWPQDQERTLVHELLHLHVGSFYRPEEGSKEEELMEQAIHALSLALLDLAALHYSPARDAPQPA